LQQAIDERRLAVVDMRDDRDITELHEVRLFRKALSDHRMLQCNIDAHERFLKRSH
jgi:hypothetical protein